MRGLTLLYGGAALAVGLWLILGLLPEGAAPGFAREWVVGGLGVIVFPTLLVAFIVSVATLILTGTRLQYSEAFENQTAETPTTTEANVRTGSRLGAIPSMAAVFATPGSPATWDRRIVSFFGAKSGTVANYRAIKADPGFAARQGQALIITTGAIIIWIAEQVLWPGPASASMELAASAGLAAVGMAFAFAFLSLVAERFVKEFPEPQLPEVPAIRRVLFFTTVMIAAAACLEIARSSGITWLHWAVWILACLPGLIMLEFTVRALARLFVPQPLPSDATAVTDSLLISLVTGGPRAPNLIIRQHLGLDFSRSWAISYLSKAMLPAIFGTGLLCWVLTGVKLIDLGQRGVYERLGAPVGVLGPGLHVILPWPLGRLRPVEYGDIHSVHIGVDQQEADESISLSAEAAPPVALNRLWESTHPGQAYYLVPSVGTGPQGFQSVATEISVLYRVGLSDSAALQSLYTVADPQSLIREDAGRLVLRFFNSRTLEAVIGARRENVADSLRDQLAADVATDRAGIDIVAVLVEEIHPPTGAAAAYHAVQAAEINASASIFDEQAKAELTAGNAQQEAHQMTSAADAKAAEIRRVADSAAYRFDADRHAYTTGGKAFLLERFYGNLDAALSKVPVTIIDHRLNTADGTILDLRAPSANNTAPSSAAPAPLMPGIESGH